MDEGETTGGRIAGGGGRRWDDDDFAEGVVAGFAIGTTLSMAAARSMSSGSQASCTMTSVTVAGVVYYRCGSNWYQKSYTSGEPAFAVVAPPPGY